MRWASMSRSNWAVPPPPARRYDYEYVIETCRGEIIEGLGGEIQCLVRSLWQGLPHQLLASSSWHVQAPMSPMNCACPACILACHAQAGGPGTGATSQLAAGAPCPLSRMRTGLTSCPDHS